MFRKLFVTLCVLVLCSAYASADDYFPGPTYPDLGGFEVIDTKLAVKVSGKIDEPKVCGIKADDIVFPDTYINMDSYMAWKINTETGEIEKVGADKEGLSEKMKQAVNIAPAWLRTALIDTFITLQASDSEAFAEMILNPQDDRYIDELAFLVAYTSVDDLNYTNMVTLLEENVRLIYDYDQFLDYVEVVDYGQPGDEDYYTTVSYIVLEDGNPVEYELPKEIYYWNIVAPKLDHEDIEYIEPHTGRGESPNDGGVFYRNYFMYDADGEDSYTAPYFMRNPNVITEAMLQNWSQTGTSPSARTCFSARNIYNIDAAYHENGNPVTVEFAYGKGTVIATTMLMIDECDDGNCEVLDNFLSYGPGDMDLALDKKILIINDDIPGKVGVGAFLETRLTTLGFTDIAHTSPSEVLMYLELNNGYFNDYSKIILPDSLAHETYLAFADKMPSQMYSWLSGGYRVLQMHLGTGDLSDLTFIGGYQVAAPDKSDTDLVTMGGRPLLYDVITLADHVWDGEVYGGLSGDRSIEGDNGMALKLLGNWAGKNMLDNVAEYAAKLNLSPGATERAVEPVRVIFNHYGNCGECQDVWTAVLRTCLIPGLNVSDINEDHVWNEFFHDGSWYYLQNDWSNGATRIATPGGGQDTDYGGGKTTSFIFGWDGEGRNFSVIDRYSESITLEVNLTDAAGQPVPGATIWIGSEGYYSGSNSWSFFIFTDADGHAQTTLGDNRNYYLRVDSGAGYWPDDSDRHSVKVVEADDATPGSTHVVDHEMEEVINGENSLEEQDDQGRYGVHLTFEILNRFQKLYNPLSRVRYTGYPEINGVNVYLVDKENYENARMGVDSYVAAKAWENVVQFDKEIYPPGDDKIWYLVVSNKSNPKSMMPMTVTAEPLENSGDDDDDDDIDDDDDSSGDDDDDDEGCCGC